MIPIERLHYKVDMKLNKLASNEHQWVSAEDKDLVIHEQSLRLIKEKVGLNNIYKQGFDSFRKRYQDLQFLVVEDEEIVPQKEKSLISIYSFDIKDLKHQFFLPVKTYFSASRDTCKDRMIWVEEIAKHSDISFLLSATDRQPSFEYQAAFAEMSSDKFRIYTEQSPQPFKADKVFITYLRYPKKVSIGGYPDIDGNILTKQDCEFPEHLEDELLNMVVEELAFNTENQFAAQAAQIKASKAE